MLIRKASLLSYVKASKVREHQRRITNNSSETEKRKRKWLRQGLNTLCQGTAADIMKIIHLRLSAAGLGVMLQIHDAFLVKVKSETSDE